MADKPAPTLEEGITGPRVPAGFSGIRPWVMGYKPLALVLLLGGGVYFFTHPLTMHSAAQAGTMNGKVSPVDAGAIVAQPHVTLAPHPRPVQPTPQRVAASDVGAAAAQPVGAAAAPPGAVAVAEPAQLTAAAPAAQPAPVSPPTESPAQVAARERDAADRAALAAPLPPVAPITPGAERPKDASAYDTAPPPFPFLAPGTEVDVSLYTSIDSTVQGAGTGTLIGYVGKDVLDAYKRVVVIPRNSKALGHLVSTAPRPGQSRVGVVWTGILLPNQHLLSLVDAPGIDLTGTLGFGAAIDNHTRKELVNVLAFSVLAAGAQIAQPAQSNGYGGYAAPSVGQSIGQAVGKQIASMAANAYNRSSQVQPTAHVVEGAQVGIMLTNFMPMQAWDATQ